MIETQLQQLVIDAMEDGGHSAMKMNNEYVRGVSDLLIKMQTRPAFFLEAKRTVLSKRTLGNPDHVVRLDVTHLQKGFMRDWRAAGMWCGVVSFLLEADGDVRSARMNVMSYGACVDSDWTCRVEDHWVLGGKVDRFVNIRGMIWDRTGE